MKNIPVIIGNNEISINKTVTDESLTFKSLNITEKAIEEFVRQNPDEIFDEETLLIIGQQVQNTSNGYSDLVAIDENGKLVVIEIKRDVEDIKARREKFEYQAIRYAASLAKIESPDELVDLIFARYIDKYASEFSLEGLTSIEKGRRILNDFLEGNNALNTFNESQRIVLIASDFDDQTKSAVAWLISSGVDIACYTLCPGKQNDMTYIQVDRLLPPDDLNDYFIGIKDNRAKSYNKKSVNKERTIRRKLPKMDKLFEWGILKSGDKLYIKNRVENIGTALDAKFVEVNGQQYSYHEWVKNVTGWSSVQTYAFVIKSDVNKTLSQLREEKMKEIAQEANATSLDSL